LDPEPFSFWPGHRRTGLVDDSARCVVVLADQRCGDVTAGFPLRFFPSGSYSPIGAFLTELFPTRLRGSAQGLSFNFGRGIGALLPTLMEYLSASFALGEAVAVFAAAAFVVMMMGIALLPETRGKELRAHE
jgi:hypothetical protein